MRPWSGTSISPSGTKLKFSANGAGPITMLLSKCLPLVFRVDADRRPAQWHLAPYCPTHGTDCDANAGAHTSRTATPGTDIARASAKLDSAEPTTASVIRRVAARNRESTQ